MRIGLSSVLFAALCAAAATASAQAVGDEIVIPAGDFAKDDAGIVTEAGSTGGAGAERGPYRFPETSGPVVVGLSTRLPASWVGHEIEVVFVGGAAQLFNAHYRIEGMVENTAFGVTANLRPETVSHTHVPVLTGHLLTGRRFGIAIGRNAPADRTTATMNFDFLILRITS